MIQKLINTLPRLLLFLGLIYTFIPFETPDPTLSIKIRLVISMLITWYALHVAHYKLKLNTNTKIALILIALFTLVAAIISFDTFVFTFSGAIFFGTITASVIKSNTKFANHFIIALRWLIIFSCSMLLLQIIYFVAMGNVLQIHELIYPMSEARIGVQTHFGSLHRLGGMYIEPGTYSNFMYLFLILYLVLTKNITSPIVWIGAITIIITVSVWGMIFGSYLLLLIILAKIKHSSWIKKIFLLLALSIISLSSVNYIVNTPAFKFATTKLNVGDGSVSAKEDAYRKFSENYFDYLIIGEGFKSRFGKGIASIQDAGILLNLSLVFGMLFTFSILIYYLRTSFKLHGYNGVLLIIPLAFSKIYYWDFSFWLLFFLLISNVQQNKRR